MVVTLGKKYRDKVHGFEGVATSRHEYLTGCTRITLERLSADGTEIKRETFDEPELEKVPGRAKGSSPKKTDRGGPRDMPSARSVPSRG